MSFGDPNNPYGPPPQGGQQPGGQQPGYGAPQEPGYGYPQQAPQGVPQQGHPQQGYGYPQAPPVQPYGGPYPGGSGYGEAPPFAHWGLRFLATLVDGLTFAVAYAFVGLGEANDIPALSFIGGVLFIAWAIYQLILEGRRGQTIGKRALGIKLVSESTGQPIGVGMAFVRRLAHFLDSIACYLGWLWPLWDSKKQTFADKVCSTLVIRAR